MQQGGDKSRVDTRMTAMLPAKMRDERKSWDVRIGDLSPKGMLVVSSVTPERGAIVEVIVNGYHLAGEVRWVSGRRMGLRMRERIPVADVLSGKPPQRRAAGKKTAQPNEPDSLAIPKLVLSYGLMAVTALATAYLIATYVL